MFHKKISCVAHLSLRWNLLKSTYPYILRDISLRNYLMLLDFTTSLRVILQHHYVTVFGRVLIYPKCKSVGYWYIVVICQIQLRTSIHKRSTTTIRDSSGINYLLQALVFLAKIGIPSIISGSKNSKLNTF